MVGTRSTLKEQKQDGSKDVSSLLWDPDFSLWSMLHQTRQLMFLVREEELGQHDLSTIESSVLFVIQAIEQTGETQATLGEIARWLFRRPHTISQLVDRMERKGLVTKVNLADTRNSKKIVLTERGREAYKKSVERRSVHRIMSALSDDDRKALRSCLAKLYKKSVKELGIKLHFPDSLRR